MNTQYQDFEAHKLRTASDPSYQQWNYTFLQCSGSYELRGKGLHDPYTFLMQIYDAGYEPGEALDLFKIASAEALARIDEQSKAFVEARDYLLERGYRIMHVPNWEVQKWDMRAPRSGGFFIATPDEVIKEAQYLKSQHTNNHGQDDRLNIDVPSQDKEA